MTPARQPTLADILIVLRQRMVNARDRFELEPLAELVTAFSLMADAAAEHDNPRATEVIRALDRATRHAIMEIRDDQTPTVENIRQALD